MGLTMTFVHIFLALMAFLLYLFKKRLTYWKTQGIASEDPHPVMGNMNGLGTTKTFPYIWREYYRKFRNTGPFFGFYFYNRPAVFILDPALIKNILIKDFNKFTNRGLFYNEKDDPLTGQLPLLDGSKWRSMRTKLTPTFTSGKMKLMFPVVTATCDQFVDVLSQMSKVNPIIEMREMLARFTTDVIGSCAFGIECCSLKDPNAKFHVIGQKSVGDLRHGTLVMAFMASFPKLAARLRLKMFPEYVIKFFLRIVKETVEYREKNKVRRNDFMDMLIDLKNKKLIKSESGKDLTNLTMGELTAQAFTFFTAGFESSSITLSYALYELAQHKDIQDKAREEVLRVMEENQNKFTYESLKDMTYLEQIISETLRLYTVVPMLYRQSLEDYVVPGHPKYVIRKGMRVLIPAGPIHLDERYYPNPQTFNPDNFLPAVVAERDPILYLPFGDGPRNCIGMRFAKMQTIVGLAMLLKNFKFSVCSETEIPLQYVNFSFVLNTQNGITLKVTRI